MNKYEKYLAKNNRLNESERAYAFSYTEIPNYKGSIDEADKIMIAVLQSYKNFNDLLIFLRASAYSKNEMDSGFNKGSLKLVFNISFYKTLEIIFNVNNATKEVCKSIKYITGKSPVLNPLSGKVLGDNTIEWTEHV